MRYKTGQKVRIGDKVREEIDGEVGRVIHLYGDKHACLIRIAKGEGHRSFLGDQETMEIEAIRAMEEYAAWYVNEDSIVLVSRGPDKLDLFGGQS